MIRIFKFVVLSMLGLSLSMTPAYAATIQQSQSNPFYWRVDDQETLLLGASFQDNPFQWADGHDGNILRNQLNTLRNVGGNYIRNTMSIRKTAFPYSEEGMARPFTLNANGKYDLNNLASGANSYFDRLRKFLQETSNRGIIVQLELWDRWSIIGSSRWAKSPWNPANNVNFPNNAYTRTNFFEAVLNPRSNRQIVNFQEAYIAEMLRISLQFDNVIYQINNESEFDFGISDYWANFVHAQARQAGKSVYVCDSRRYHPDSYTNRNFRIISNSENSYPINNFNRFNFLDVAQNGGNVSDNHYENLIWYRNQVATVNARPINHTKIYSFVWPTGVKWNDRSFSNDDARISTNRFWRSIFGGAASIRFHRDIVDANTNRYMGIGLTVPSKNHIRSARMLTTDAQGIGIFQMEPNNGLITSGRQEAEAFVLERPNLEYAVLLSGGDFRYNASADEYRRFSVNNDIGLRLPNGTYTQTWLNINASRWESRPNVTSNGTVNLNLPDGQQYVAVLKPVKPVKPPAPTGIKLQVKRR